MEEKEEESIAVQEVWSWGAGTEGQLGTEKLQDEHWPQLLHSLFTFDPISFLSCGGAHVIALTSGGRVLTWGRGTSGQLGHGEMVNSLQPKPLESLGGFVITHASAGWNHSGFVSENGCLFTCGDGSFGQLGHGDYDSRCSPEKVSCLNAIPVLQIACGMRHSLALIKDDVGYRVHGFGSGKRGQLGISKDKVRLINTPQATLGLEDVTIVSIHADGDHSAALSDNGRLYTWGRGFGGASDTHVPECFYTDLSFSQAALGWNHALLLTADAEIFMLGSYGNGILISSEVENQETHRIEKSIGALSRIPGLHGRKVLQVAAGAEHSALVSDDGKIMTWGWGEHGQLGLGHTVDQTIPQVVNIGERLGRKHLCNVYCGSGFTYVVETQI